MPSPEVIYPAVTKYAPASVTKVANDVLRPEVDRAVSTVRARPRTITKVPARLVAEVIAAIDDPNVLAAIIDSADRRIVTRRNIADHPMRERAERLRFERNHPWARLSLDEISALVHGDETKIIYDTLRAMITWCRSRPDSQKAAAYKLMLDALRQRGRSSADLVVDVVAGRVPGFDPVTEGYADPDNPRRFTKALVSDSTLNRKQFDAAMRCYPVIDTALAEVITVNGLALPVRSVDHITADAIRVLLASSEAVELYARGVVTDPTLLLEVIDRIGPHDRAQLSRIVNDPQVVDALISGLGFSRPPAGGGDLTDLLNLVPDLPTSARLVALSHASGIELRDFVNGRMLNTPRAGEVSHIVDLIRSFNTVTDTDQPPRWRHTSMTATVLILGACAPSPAAIEGVQRLLDTYGGVVSTILNDEGLVGRLGVSRIHNRIGNDPNNWEMLLRLAENWAGTLDELITTAQIL